MAVARSKESIERGSAARGKVFLSAITCRCSLIGSSTSLLRLMLVICLVALAVLTGFTYPLLGAEQVQVVFSGNTFANWNTEAISEDIHHVEERDTKISALNETFILFAAIDPNEEQEKRKIKIILDGNEIEFRSAQSRWSYPRRMDHYVDIERPRRKVRPRYESWLLQLQSPRYGASWPRFRELLQAWSRNKRYDPHVMEELLETVKKPMDAFYSSEKQLEKPLDGNKRYKTCAVVGNSGILLNRSFGSFIDNHDLVVRLNNAKVAGFEDSVGTKTSLSFVNSNIYHTCARRLRCFCHPYGDVPIVMYLCQVHHLMDIAFCEPNHSAPVLVTDPRFDTLCARLVKWYSVKHYVEVTGNPIQKWDKDHNARDFHYSSGLQAMVLALGLCENVDMFGFGKSPEAKHHYHTNQKTELDLHDYAAEYLFYDDLIFNRTAIIPFLREVGIHLPRVKIYRVAYAKFVKKKYVGYFDTALVSKKNSKTRRALDVGESCTEVVHFEATYTNSVRSAGLSVKCSKNCWTCFGLSCLL